jgi:hypothetical protein
MDKVQKHNSFSIMFPFFVALNPLDCYDTTGMLIRYITRHRVYE